MIGWSWSELILRFELNVSRECQDCQNVKITIHLGASENSGLQVKFSSIGSPGYFASGLSSEWLITITHHANYLYGCFCSKIRSFQSSSQSDGFNCLDWPSRESIEIRHHQRFEIMEFCGRFIRICCTDFTCCDWWGRSHRWWLSEAGSTHSWKPIWRGWEGWPPLTSRPPARSRRPPWGKTSLPAPPSSRPWQTPSPIDKKSQRLFPVWRFISPPCQALLPFVRPSSEHRRAAPHEPPRRKTLSSDFMIM